MNAPCLFPIALAASICLCFGMVTDARADIVPGFDAKKERTWSSKAIVDAPGWWANSERLEGGTLRLRGVMGRSAEVSVLIRGAVSGGKATAAPKRPAYHCPVLGAAPRLR